MSGKYETKPFRIGKNTYQKVGTLPREGDFVRLASVLNLIPHDISNDDIHLLGNREGVQVYRLLKR